MPGGSGKMNNSRTPLRILMLGNPSSIHTLRWVSQFKQSDVSIVLFDPLPELWSNWHSDIRKSRSSEIAEKIKPAHLFYPEPKSGEKNLQIIVRLIKSFLVRILKNTQWIDNILNSYLRRKWKRTLKRMILHSDFDLIHSLGLNLNWNNYCQPIVDLKKQYSFPALWIYSSWGTDLSFYASLSKANEQEVRDVLTSVDGYIAESEFDHKNALAYGFSGKFLGIFPAFGGINLDYFNKFKGNEPPSQRKKIFIKGRGSEDPVGRAMHVLDAIEKIHTDLLDYEIIIGQSTPSIRARAEEISKQYGIRFSILPFLDDPDQILEYIGQSRLYISITINDGLPASLIEAMVLGAFPIFSNLPSLAEWIESGKNGVLIDLHDVNLLVHVIKRMLKEDHLVDQASIQNAQIVRERINEELIVDQTIKAYQDALSS